VCRIFGVTVYRKLAEITRQTVPKLESFIPPPIERSWVREPPGYTVEQRCLISLTAPVRLSSTEGDTAVKFILFMSDIFRRKMCIYIKQAVDMAYLMPGFIRRRC